MFRSWSVKSVFSAWAKVPFMPRSQQDRRLCRYAPLPAALPVGSIRIPLRCRTTLIRDRFGKIWRHPTQVRCGICLTLLPVLFVTCHSLNYKLLFPFPTGSATFVFLFGQNHITVRIVGQFYKFLLLLLALLTLVAGFFIFFFSYGLNDSRFEGK